MLTNPGLRDLSLAERDKLQKEKVISDFKRNKLELEASRNWDLFYKRNSNNFFKDRHWLTREFPALTQLNQEEGGRVLEVGCGVGNTIFPLLEECPNLFIHGCDLSVRAVDLVKTHAKYNDQKIHVFVCDLTLPLSQDTSSDTMTSHVLADNINPDSVDLVTLIFVLSAISPDKMKSAISNIFKVLKPGGSVLFRDYGLYDHAMLRFKSGHKIQDQFYVRQDGTRAFYFSLEDTLHLFEECGYEIVFNNYERRETVNKKEGISVPRIFVQSQFRKPNL